jgi:methionyl-tRNA formyltransferase
VQTGEGVVRLLTLQREGRRPVSAREFTAGSRLAPGARFRRPTSAS